MFYPVCMQWVTLTNVKCLFIWFLIKVFSRHLSCQNHILTIQFNQVIYFYRHLVAKLFVKITLLILAHFSQVGWWYIVTYNRKCNNLYLIAQHNAIIYYQVDFFWKKRCVVVMLVRKIAHQFLQSNFWLQHPNMTWIFRKHNKFVLNNCEKFISITEINPAAVSTDNGLSEMQ